MTTDDAHVLVRTDGRAGYITLNRPQALNALSDEMVRLIDGALSTFEAAPAIQSVVISGAGERGFCAGGDIRALYEDLRDGSGTLAPVYWRREYRLDARIARYPKPYVAIMDGLCFGGGVGIAGHGSVRIVTERSQVAMPETGIGFFPDVGGLYLLARAPGEVGTHLALTGIAAGGADALFCGLADHYVPSERLPELFADLATWPVADAVARSAEEPPAAGLASERAWIDECYAAGTVEEILERLKAHRAPGAREALEVLRSVSPTSLKVTLRAIRRARDLDSLADTLRQDYRVACAFLSVPDLMEGIRARLIDRDRNPRWSPSNLADVSEADVERFFAPLGDGELDFG